MAKLQHRKNEATPVPSTIQEDSDISVVEIVEVVTPEEEKKIIQELERNKIPPAIGELVQVEGLVLKEVNELTIKLNTGADPLEQILSLKKFVKENWHYVFDPAVDHDTWRSAEATLSLKYMGKYSGDCDDFAILMASFARQIGLRSMVVGGFDENGSGHAFAVFAWPNSIAPSKDIDYHRDGDSGIIWASLDWFSGQDHFAYSNLEVLISVNQ
jgi:transglutaminase-like putative cysteine protease